MPTTTAPRPPSSSRTTGAPQPPVMRLPRFAEGGDTTGGDRALFIRKYAPVAARWAAKTGIPADVFLGIAASESNFGNTPGYALFGMVGINGTAGQVSLRTQTGTQQFAAYNSPDDAFEAFANTVKRGYPQAMAAKNDSAAFIRALQAGGYAGNATAEDRAWSNNVINTWIPTVQSEAKKQGVTLGAAQMPDTAATSTASAFSTLPRDQQRGWTLPAAGSITSLFGEPFGMDAGRSYQGKSYAHFNAGIDIGAGPGSAVYSLTPGKVVSAGPTGDGWGYAVRVQDPDGRIHNYGHTANAQVKVGDTVTPGTQLASVGAGQVGTSTGPHLSYDVWDADGSPVDPTPFLTQGGQGQTAVHPSVASDSSKVRQPTYFQATGSTTAGPKPPGTTPAAPNTTGYRTNVDPDLMTRFNASAKAVDATAARITELQNKAKNGGLSASESYELDNTLPGLLRAQNQTYAELWSMVKPGAAESPSAQEQIGINQQNANTGTWDAFTKNAIADFNSRVNQIHTAFGDDVAAKTLALDLNKEVFAQNFQAVQAKVLTGRLSLDSATQEYQRLASLQNSENMRFLAGLNAMNIIADKNLALTHALLPAGTEYQPGFAPDDPMSQLMRSRGFNAQVIRVAPVDMSKLDPEQILARQDTAMAAQGYTRPVSNAGQMQDVFKNNQAISTDGMVPLTLEAFQKQYGALPKAPDNYPAGPNYAGGPPLPAYGSNVTTIENPQAAATTNTSNTTTTPPVTPGVSPLTTAAVATAGNVAAGAGAVAKSPASFTVDPRTGKIMPTTMTPGQQVSFQPSPAMGGFTGISTVAPVSPPAKAGGNQPGGSVNDPGWQDDPKDYGIQFNPATGQRRVKPNR